MSVNTYQLKTDIDIDLGIEILLKSGSLLKSIIYKPKNPSKPLPVLIAGTVYSADGLHQIGCYFARNGYIFISFEFSGRGNSGGTFEFWANDGKEGAEVIEWATQQSWSNGKVAMWGGSYNGFHQWAVLKECPTALATIIPVSPVCPGVDFPVLNNMVYSQCIPWLALIAGKTTNVRMYSDEPLWESMFYDLLQSGRPFRELGELGPALAPLFHTILQQPSAAVWRKYLLEPEHYEVIAIPILTITGQHDGDHLGALHFYRMHMRHGSKEWTEQHYLIIGPWDHAGTRKPATTIGGLQVGEASSVDMDLLQLQWYDWVMRDGERPSFCQARVAYYVTGAEEWRYAHALDSIPTIEQNLFLTSSLAPSVPHDIFHSGYLMPALPADSALTSTYAYDSRDARDADLGGLQVVSWVTDQRYVINLSGNGLIYHSPILDEDLEIIGFPRLVAWLSLNVPDADFQVTLYEILRDGSSILLTQDLMRARYRYSLMEETLVTPGAIERYEFDSFRFVARRLARGSRLRLVICTPDILFWQRNYGGGGVVEDESAEVGSVISVTLYQDPEHQSVLVLPVSRPQTKA